MKAPNHKVKIFATQVSLPRYMQKPYWIENPVHGWLASGLKDKNDVEIFEGDKVIFGDLEFQGVVIFKNGALGVEFNHFCKERFMPLDSLIGFTEFEIVGHITDTAEGNNHVDC